MSDPALLCGSTQKNKGPQKFCGPSALRLAGGSADGDGGLLGKLLGRAAPGPSPLAQAYHSTAD